MKTIISFALSFVFSSFAYGEGGRAISSALEARSFFRSSRDGNTYSSLDSNGDQKSDVQTLESGNTKTEYFSDSKKFLIQNIDTENRTIIEGTVIEDKPLVQSIITIKNKTRLQETDDAEGKAEICKRIESNVSKITNKDLSNLTRTQLSNLVGDLFDENCDENYIEQCTKQLSTMLFSVMGRGGKISCIEQMTKDARVAYEQKKISENELLKYELAFAESKAFAADVLDGKTHLPLFKCELSKSDSVRSGADGTIVVGYTSGGTNNFGAPQAGLMQRWGVLSDANLIIKNCKSGDSPFKERKLLSKIKETSLALESLKDSYAVSQSLTTSVAFNESAKAASKEEIAAVNAPLAETKVILQSPTEASPQALAKIQATQGDAAVQQVMAKQSSGIMTMTNAVMSAVNTQAIAGTGSSSSSSRSVASTKSDTSLSSTANKTRSTVSGLRKTNIGKDEQIVEEILVGDNNKRTATTARRAGTQAASATRATRAPANIDGGAEGTDAQVAGASAELGRGGRASGGSGGGSVASSGRGRSGKKSGGGGQEGSGAGNSRAPASASSSGDSSPEQVSSDEIVSYIKNADYQSTKSKIKDYKFQNKLKVNSITIIDRSGNSVGAAEGKIIFIDKGNRFEKQ